MTHLLGFLFNLSTAECLTHARQARLGDQKHQKKNVMPQTGLRRSLCTVQEVFPSAALALLQAAPDVVNKLSLSTSAAKETFHTVHGEIVHQCIRQLSLCYQAAVFSHFTNKCADKRTLWQTQGNGWPVFEI